MCKNPLDPYVITNDMREYKIAMSFSYMVTPPDFTLNRAGRAYINGKTRLLCTCCKHNRRNRLLTPKTIRNREIGKMIPLQRSISFNDINVWWERFERFGTRPDVEEYLIENSELFYPDNIDVMPPIREIFFTDIWVLYELD
jgi:hypothetical protein